MMTGPTSQVEGDDDVLMLLDISPAHLHSLVFVTIDGKVYKLSKALYSLRDAGVAFDRKVLDVRGKRRRSSCLESAGTWWRAELL